MSFKLEEKKIQVHPVVKATGFINQKNHKAAFLAPNAKNRFVTPIDKKTGKYKQILTLEEEKHLSELLYQDLSINVRVDNFWDNFTVELGKNVEVKDLSEPIQFIEYKVLLVNKDYIAPDKKSSGNKTTYKYYINDLESEAATNTDKILLRERISDLFKELRKDRTKMIKLLEISGKKVSQTVSDSFLINEINNIYVENVPEYKQQTFVSMLTDGDFSIRALVQEAIQAGIIVKNKNKYSLQGGDVLAHSQDALVKFLKTKKNQETKLLIEEQIKEQIK
jgi:hypothetical protein